MKTDEKKLDETGTMRVGVVISALHAEATIVETLDSLLNQTRRAHRVAVVIDGQDPATEALARGHPVVTDCLMLKENVGAAEGRNVGCGLVADEVDVLCLLDADDIIAPWYLSSSTQILEDDESVGFISTMFSRWVDGTPRELLQAPTEAQLQSDELEVLTLANYSRFTGRVLLGFSLVRCSVLDAIRSAKAPLVSSLRNNHDFELIVRLIATHRCVRLNVASGWYRVMPNSLSANGAGAWRGRMQAAAILRDWAAETGRTELHQVMSRARGIAVRRAARHDWVNGDRGACASLLLGDLFRNGGISSLALLILLALGLDRPIKSMTKGDQRAQRK